MRVSLTSFEIPSFLELLQPELFWSDAHQRYTAGPKVRLQFADLRCNPTTYLTAKPAQEEQDHRLVLPQRLERHTLAHTEGVKQWNSETKTQMTLTSYVKQVQVDCTNFICYHHSFKQCNIMIWVHIYSLQVTIMSPWRARLTAITSVLWGNDRFNTEGLSREHVWWEKGNQQPQFQN